jgi:hypothetical protein
MKKLILTVTLLGTMSSFAAEYKIKVNNTEMFQYYGSISGEILDTKHSLHMDKKVILSPSTPEVYEQLQNLKKGQNISVKGYSDLKSGDGAVTLRAVSVSE